MTTPFEISNSNKYGVLQNQPQNKNPLIETRYRFSTRKIPNVTYMCQGLHLPGMKIEVAKQETLFNPMGYPAGQIQQQELKIDFLVEESFDNWFEMYNWIKECSNYTDFSDYTSVSKNIISDATVLILDSKQNPKIKFQFQNVFPVELSTINFETTSPDATMVSVEARFHFTDYSVTKLYND